MPNYFHVLKLDPSADQKAVDEAALKLTEKLSQPLPSKKAEDQAKIALNAVRNAHEEITADKEKAQSQCSNRSFNSRLRLGQLCLASGMISLEQLQEAVHDQQNSERQLGEILQDKQFISQEELDGLLIGQELIAPEEQVDDPLALQLIALGLISDELMMIALLEQRFASGSIGDTLTRKGWIEPEIIAALK